jgi:hypothetical protein
VRGLLALALGCGGAPEPDDVPVVAEPPVETWRLLGRTGDGWSSPEAESARDECGAPERCSVETWSRDGAAPLHLVRDPDRMWRSGRRDTWRTTWRGLSGSLALCIGAPLAIPPATDPAGFRLLHERDGAFRWTVHLSGANPCGLSGQLELDALADRVRPHDLRVDGLAWAEGGRELAQERARSLARAEAEARWAAADADERARILAALRQDPGSAELVRRLEATP